MNSGLYAALTGNLTAMRKLDVVSNNLANANTTGFKQDRLAFQSLLANTAPAPAGLTDAPVMASERFYTDFSQGPLKQTDNSLDVAIEGDGFFVVQTANGPAYTRQGNFSRNAAGRLINADGLEVQGAGGPITINGGTVDINARGEINVDGVRIGALQIVDFPKPYVLQKIGSSLFMPADPQAAPQPAANARISQGFIENSNVSVVREMVQLIEASRYFETCQRVVQSYDNIASKAANDLGRI